MSKDDRKIVSVQINYDDGTCLMISERSIAEMIRAGEALDMIHRAKEIAKQLVG